MKFSIVTPSFNQAAFVQATLDSVLGQQVQDLEYVVMDGGSSDASPEIIRRYSDRLVYWESERDRGQYDAITRGFAKCSGEVMGWLNSDDQYTPWALSVVEEIFEKCPHVQWLTTTTQLRWDARGRAVRALRVPGYSASSFLAGEYLPRVGQFALGWIQQESTFWRRSLWEKAGAQVGQGYPLAGDFELWARFFKHAELYAVDTPLGGFRFHGDQKTGGDRLDYLEEAERALISHGGRRHGALARMLRRRGYLRSGARLIRHNRNTNDWSSKNIDV